MELRYRNRVMEWIERHTPDMRVVRLAGRRPERARAALQFWVTPLHWALLPCVTVSTSKWVDDEILNVAVFIGPVLLRLYVWPRSTWIAPVDARFRSK